MNYETARAESKLKDFIQQYESEWFVICGLKAASCNETLKILRILRNEGLYELEAMMIWKMEYLELDKIKEKESE